MPLLILALCVLTACTMTTDSDPATDAATDTDATPIPTLVAPSSDAPLIVTWAAGGDLFVWRSSDQAIRRIASGGVIRPFVSPNGAWIAFLRGPDGDPRTLWITDTPGANERQLIDATNLPATDTINQPHRLNQIVWGPDSDTIYFNTIMGDGISALTADDLWRVAAQTGTTDHLLPNGTGGQITISPDGYILAVATAGQYAPPGETSQIPGQIAFYDLATRERTVVLEFPAVASASETRWYPTPRWLPDSTGLRVAIPPVDLVYGTADQGTQTALWWLPVEGAAIQTGAVDADYFSLPTFSADGEWITYMARRTAQEQGPRRLMVARFDGTQSELYREVDVAGLLFPDHWLLTGNRFVFGYGAPPAFFIGQPDAEEIRFPGQNVAGGGIEVSSIIWVDEMTYVYSVRQISNNVYQGYELGYGTLNSSPQFFASLEEYPIFDAVFP
ncbi:MAG: PD40 domain-containing protein [Anaerolineae bacterium]|nr:PD40 domain-containing protein [Anaerolineae bacterium]